MDPAKLAKLSREQKLELLDLLDKKAELKKHRRDEYEPNEGQAVAHASAKRERYLFCGNGFGKTTFGVQETLAAVQGYNPWLKTYTSVPARAYIILDKPEKIAEVILPEIRKWYNLKEDQLHKNGKPYYAQISFPNGSTITFVFHEQSELSAEGVEGEWFWFDEPAPRRLFVALLRAGRTKGKHQRYLLTGTPITAAWLRQEVYEKWVAGELPDAECFRFTTEMNRKNLADGWIESFGRYLSDKEKEIRLNGQFFDLDGLALAHLFSRKTHVVPRFEWPREWPVVVAIDPHPKKANHACMLGVDRNGQLYYIKEMRERSVAREFAKSLHKFTAGYRVTDIVCDSLGSSEMTGGEGFRSFIDVLRDERINVRPTRYDEKLDEAWIERIQSVLAIPTEPDQFGQCRPGLLFMEGNPGIVSDVENVQFAKMRGVDELKPKLEISNKDFLSTLKYALAASLDPDAGRHGTMLVRKKPVTSYGQTARPMRLRFRRKTHARPDRRAESDD